MAWTHVDGLPPKCRYRQGYYCPIFWITIRIVLVNFLVLTVRAQQESSFCRSPNDFPCRLHPQTCIPRIKWQDGKEDCPDGSDEECLAWQYDCKFGKPKCINLFNLMDGSIDCSSGFDEACPAHYFICMDKSDCIEPNRYLDGQMDCRDGSDEPCPAAHFLCHDRSKCIQMNLFQDGKPDCPDGSDEECTLFQFECLCGEPRCVGVEKFNDGVRDCADGSDDGRWENDVVLSADYTCPDGSRPRDTTIVVPHPPPGAPMVPCGPEDLNLCSPQLGEMCLIIAGAPRCMCQMGHIRPPGSASCSCVPAPTTRTPGRPLKIPPEVAPNVTPSLKLKKEELSVQKTTPATQIAGTCNPNEEFSCPSPNDECVETNGLYACQCQLGFTRNPTNGICVLLVNECSDPSLNQCDPNAICMDNPLSYECLCAPGWIDMSAIPQTNPGRHCVPLKDECELGQHDCDSHNADCLDLPGGYTCRCKNGFRDISPDRARNPGRRCSSFNAVCSNATRVDCHNLAVCQLSTDSPEGYTCRCPEGMIDLSPNFITKPGRQCADLQRDCISSLDCNENAECDATNSGFTCRCKPGYLDRNPSRPGTDCYFGSNPCLDASLNDCDRHAECTSKSPGFFECGCPAGFVDLSRDTTRYPGRICQQIVNECSSGAHDCDINAICTDTPESYECRCRLGFEDISLDKAKPGRHCRQAESCATTTCAAEADCQETSNGPVCSCRPGYVDLSHLRGVPFGHVCEKLINECHQGTHDCSPSADCIDSPDGFLCRCHDSYRDESPDFRRAGRVCVKTFVPDPPECDVNDPLSCDEWKLEICAFVNSTYKCQCPTGFGRLPDGRCKVRDECRDIRLNDCHRNAQCIDQAEDYTCQCKSGFADVSPDPVNRPGRICKQRNDECSDPSRFRVDCDRNAVCVDTEESFTCRCLHGYADVSENYNLLPGRRCVQAINECLEANDCSQNAICEDAMEGYVCKCRDGFVDASFNNTHYPGRICIKPRQPGDPGSVDPFPFQLEECDPNNSLCGRGESCLYSSEEGRYVCQCGADSIRFEDGTCRLFSACAGNSDCDENAICTNVFDSFQCQCRPGYLDISLDPIRKPGRLCKELVNECADNSLNTCSPYADCIDTREGFSCVCIDGFIDVSAQFSLPAGRHCHNSSNECSHRSLHTCDDNADCVDQPQGYTCQCAKGFLDWSTSANLPPGRVCTVQTTCPKQKTDLMFLIDGSGSIGSFVFRSEVLRFVQEFVELFDIGPENTRVGVIQYSDQIRHEFDLGQYQTQIGVLQGISEITYLTGLTRSGAAIMHMVQEGFSIRRGARPHSPSIARIAIVITDGRSQDNVSMPAEQARAAGIRVFAIGVTDHVLDSELEQIAGSRDRYFHVHDFTDLDMRLRSLIQKEACPGGRVDPPLEGTCDPSTQEGCKRALNEICLEQNGRFECGCPNGFQRHPFTRVCGHDVCNPELATSCPHPDICLRTPFGNYRCACPDKYIRHPQTGFCVGTDTSIDPPVDCFLTGPNACPENEHCVRETNGLTRCVCNAGLERNRNSKCTFPGSCDPGFRDSCDSRKKEQCLPHFSGRYNTCQCPQNYIRDSITDICLINECLTGQHDCDPNARCIDTYDSFICQCKSGYKDVSPNPSRFGRVCKEDRNDCELGTHNCSRDAICIKTDFGFLCTCKPGYVDFSPNPKQFAGLVCKKLVNECATGQHTCSANANCEDTTESYKCYCRPGFIDRDELRNPGRICEKPPNDRCERGNNDCDKQARCITRGQNDFECVCPAGKFVDKSPNPLSRPGRVCIPIVYECDNPSLNDCDVSTRADCIDTDEGFVCRCKGGFLDISPDPINRPGRLCQQRINECELGTHDCARDGGQCVDTPDSFTCRCRGDYLDVSPEPSIRPGRACKRLVNECTQGTHDCSSNADCEDTQDSYFCRCLAGFVDVSVDPVTRPGRRCLELIDECKENRHDCSPNADCVDTTESYRCQCRNDFIDESPDLFHRPGRICRPKRVDECTLGIHDCSPSANCLDRTDGFTCRCIRGYLDQSENRITRPGRVCVPKPTEPPPECRIDLATSCDDSLNEVCRLVNGEAKCTCPENVRRHPTTKSCTVINECQFPSLNDCHQNADCDDTLDGYVCRCRPGFKDESSDQNRPGRHCRPLINECRFYHLNDCSQNADCEDMEEGYRCRCKSGFRDVSPDPSRPGRICKREENECADSTKNTCDRNADCIDELQGYRCECRDGFLDISPSPGAPGRACRPIRNECANPADNDCHQLATCHDTLESYRCECPPDSKDISPNAGLPGRVCFQIENECQTGHHDCDRNFGICRDTEDSFTCECPASFVDRSPNPLTRPGRVCVKLVNECIEGRHTCHQHAECRDLEDGYTCECKDGYVDRSTDLSQPGRICGVPEVCAPNHECSSAAVCEPLGGGKYQCTCIQGYVDQSQGGLRGRVCVRANDCLDSTNDCSPHAQCMNLPKKGEFDCHCMPGYVDVGQELTGRFCLNESLAEPPFSSDNSLNISELNEQTSLLVALKDDECRNPLINDCSRNAHCIDLKQGFTCECFPNFEDRSPDKTRPGRICEPYQPSTPPPRHPCQDSNLNDCSLLGFCRSVGTGNDYTCECPQGYLDRSPDPIRKPGRVCVPTPPECMDPTRNDCHDFAICTQVSDSRQYSCRCRDGYVDISPDKSRPGRICKESVNECLDASLNDCSHIAVCENTDESYTCRCPPNTKDLSRDPNKPGRNCLYLINECQNPQLNNCSRFADCFDRDVGYECKCKDRYIDDAPSTPGRECTPVFNECEFPNLNDCDRHANCIDLPSKYTCECRSPYRDESPDRANAPGRICKFNECSDRRYHECATNAICQDTDESYVCHCKEGYIDLSPDPRHPGRVCKKAETTAPIRPPTTPKGGIICNRDYCFPALNEVCIGGVRCGCRPGQNRKAKEDSCVDVERIHLPLYVIRRNTNTLFWSSSYGTRENPRYIEITDIFNNGIERAIGLTHLSPYFITSDTNYIAPPRLFNSSWQSGLMFNFSVDVVPGSVQPESLWNELMASIFRTNYSVGGTELYINPYQLNIFEEPKPGLPCGNNFCNEDLGEVCFAGKICGCPVGTGRRSQTDQCINVEAFVLPLWVIRSGVENLIYNRSFSSPQSSIHKSFVNRFKTGCRQAYQSTQLGTNFVYAEVNDIQDPAVVNKTWDHGILYNFTVYCERGRVPRRQDVWYHLIDACRKNNFEVGHSNLFISPYQQNPFSACFKSDCHPKAICIDRGPNSYTCRCPKDYLDLNPSYQGRKCRPKFGYNECAREIDNDCGENSRCIDLPLQYRCECYPGFVDASPPGALAGSVCALDFCSDVNYCPLNSTCKNLPTRARCVCHEGYMDIRASARRISFGLEDVWCLRPEDVDECALGLTNCSAVAECRDLIVGYSCKCPARLTDGNPSSPGRICGAKSCYHCGGHGDCVTDVKTGELTCDCFEGYTGARCEKLTAGANVRLILIILFAVLFLLLTLCCLAYLCCKCRCIKGKGLWYREPLFTYRKGAWPWSTLEQSTSSESGADFSGMSSAFGKGSDYYPEMAIPRAKLAKKDRDSRKDLDVSHLASYLDSEEVRIPRARLTHSRASSVEREGGESVIFSDVHQGLPAGASVRTRDRYAESVSTDSDTSSDYTVGTEIERRVVTDVKKTETRRTITADVHGDTTAEFHVYPPVESSNLGAIRKSQEQEREEKEIYESARYPGITVGAQSERDRGQSVVEVSVAGIQGHGSEWGMDSTVFSQPRGTSEYTERDLESISEESQSSHSSSEGDDIYDKKVLVKKSRGWDPDPDGRGGTEKFKKEVNSKTLMRETNKY